MEKAPTEDRDTAPQPLPGDTATLSLAAQQAAQTMPSGNNSTDSSVQPKAEPDSAKHDVELEQTSSSNAILNPVSGDLAVAMKITTIASAPITPSAATAGTITGRNPVAASALLPTQSKHEPGAAPSLSDTTIGAETKSGPGDVGTSETKETKAASATSFEAELSKATTEQVRSAHVQITGDNNQRVDIRLLERGGALSVSVRSADTNLTRALQEHTPELSKQLSADRFKADVWSPNSQKDSQQRQSSGEPSQDRRNGGQKGNKQNQEQDPSWVTAFENTPSAFQKRINYTWHQ